MRKIVQTVYYYGHIVASELKYPICHSNECQIGSFSSEATKLKDPICHSNECQIGSFSSEATISRSQNTNTDFLTIFSLIVSL